MAVNVKNTGPGAYTITVNGRTYHVTGQTPGSVIVAGGQRVTLPGAGGSSTPASVYHPGTPFLTPDQQASFNQQLDQFNNSEIDINAGVQQAHVNYDRTIADLAHQAIVRTQNIEESMAARGQYDSGIRSSALTDLQATEALAATRAAEDLRTADALAEAKLGAINTARGNLQNWYTTTAGGNASASSYVTPGPSQPASTAPNALKNATKAAVPPSTFAGPSAHGAQGAAVLPPGTTHPGVAVPATANTYASGPPPGPGYQWNGVRWVKI